jgi:hydroxymethylpyrimidine/phosphomethylpyrimidine kinase
LAEVPPRPRVLTIAGSDSGGGAGIQADLKTFSALGVYGMTAITAVTVQNTLGVSDYLAMPPALVAEQIRSVVTDIGVDAAKTGMLATPEIIHAACDVIEELEIPNLVVDPVFMSKHGDPLLVDEAVAAIRDRLLPLATVVTPNLPEASGLVGWHVATEQDMERAGEELLELGSAHVLVKGGHLDGEGSPDLLAERDHIEWHRRTRVDSVHTHGTGCTLSAAIAAHLAMGWTVPLAVGAAKEFVTGGIAGGLPLGSGIGPVDQLWLDGKGVDG